MSKLGSVRHTSLLEHPNLATKYGLRDLERDRAMYVVQGIAPDNRTLLINDSSIHTLRTALLERLFYCSVDGTFVEPPQPDLPYVFSTLKIIRRKVLRAYGPRPSPVSPEQFVEMYKGRKRTIYEQASEQYHLEGVTREDSISSAFVKMEKVDPSKAPRNINPRTPVYNLAVGRYIKPIEHAVYGAIQRATGAQHPVVMKGFNVEEVGFIIQQKWNGFTDPVGVGLDATKFDMHVSSSILRWEHSIYLDLYNNDSELKKLLKWQLFNKGRGFAFDGKLKFNVYGRRFSGDMNTALGNCLIMCAMVHTWAMISGVHIEFVNNGDDVVVFMERSDSKRFNHGLVDYFLSLGFRMKVEPAVGVLEEVEFCQMHPVNVGGVWKMVRNFHTSREKDSIALLDISTPTAYTKWLGAVGDCGLALTSGVPILQELYACMSRHGIMSDISTATQMSCGAHFLRSGLEAKYEKVSDDSRLSFYLAFDMTPDEQVALEEYYANLDMSFAGVDTIDNLLSIDTSPF